MKVLQYRIEGVLVSVEVIISIVLWYLIIRATYSIINKVALIFLVLLFLHGLSVVFRFFWSLMKMAEGGKIGKKLP